MGPYYYYYYLLLHFTSIIEFRSNSNFLTSFPSSLVLDKEMKDREEKRALELLDLIKNKNKNEKSIIVTYTPCE